MPTTAEPKATSLATADFTHGCVADEPAKDVVEDLNEITTTYIAKGKNGEVALASYVLSARGYYAMLFYTPPSKK